MTLGSRFDAVLAAARGGASWALSAIYHDVNPLLLRYLRAHERRMAEDLAAEVWLGVAAGMDVFDGNERDFRAWVFTIARRRVTDHRRIATRFRVDPVASFERLDQRSPDDPAEEVIDGISAQEAVDRLVRDLSADQADVVLLRVVAGLNVAEVARVMGRSSGSVRVLQHRALRRLARSFPRGVIIE